MLKKLSTKNEQQTSSTFPDVSTIVKELSTDEKSQLDWSTIENVIDLTEKVPSSRLFAGQFGQNSCFRCEICFNYLFSRDGVLTKRDPLLVDDDDGQAITTHIKKYVVFLNLIFQRPSFQFEQTSIICVIDAVVTYLPVYFWKLKMSRKWSKEK